MSAPLLLRLAWLAALGVSATLECTDGSVLEESAVCPDDAGSLDRCDFVGAGELCEGDGECGTHTFLDNCNPGGWDVYKKISGPFTRASSTTIASAAASTTSAAPTTTASTTATTRTLTPALTCAPQITEDGLKVAFTEVTNLAMCKHLLPPMTDDSMAARCNDFCLVQGEQRGIPLLLGSETYGLPSTDMNGICLGEESGAENVLRSNTTEIDFCRANLGVLGDMKAQAVHFVARVEVFRAEQLAFQAEMLNMSRLLQDELTSPQFRQRMDGAIDKLALLKEKFNEFSERALTKSGNNSGLGQAIHQLRQGTRDLTRVMDDNLRKFEAFVSDCDGLFLGIGSQGEYALDICAQKNIACLEDHSSAHVTCCCGVNPLSGASLTIDGLQSTDGYVAEGRRLDSTPSEVDVCAQAKTESRAELELAHARTHSHGHQSLLDKRQSELQEAYPEYYSHCSSRRLEGRTDRKLNEDGQPNQVGACDLPPPHAGTGLEVAFTKWTNQDLCKYTAPPMSDEMMAEQCTAFCSPTGVSMLMGASTYGFSLQEANSICLPPDGVLVYNETQQCSTWSGAFLAIEAAASEFIAKLDVFEAARVLYLAMTINATREIQEYIRSQEFARKIDWATNKKETVREAIISRITAISKGSGRTELSEAVAELKGEMSNLKSVLESNLARVESFLAECNQLQVGRGPHGEYLLDICSMENGECIENPQSGHVSCCCAVNPLVALGGSAVTIDGVDNIDGGQVRGANGGAGRRVTAQAHTVDMCARAWTVARPHVLRIRGEVEAVGHGNLVIQEVEKLQAHYGQQYCAYATEDKSGEDGGGADTGGDGPSRGQDEVGDGQDEAGDGTVGDDGASNGEDGAGGDTAGGDYPQDDTTGEDGAENADGGADSHLSMALIGAVAWNSVFRP